VKSSVHWFIPFAAHAVPTCNDSDAKRAGLHIEHAQLELLHVCPKQETVRPGDVRPVSAVLSRGLIACFLVRKRARLSGGRWVIWSTTPDLTTPTVLEFKGGERKMETDAFVLQWSNSSTSPGTLEHIPIQDDWGVAIPHPALNHPTHTRSRHG
jgi:hypothetical protein